MDIRKYNRDGEWLTFEVDSDYDMGEFKFKVQPADMSGAERAWKQPDELAAICRRVVVDWNFEDGSHPIPCTAANKEKYLSEYLPFRVKKMNGVAPTQPSADNPEVMVPQQISIGVAIFNFAIEPKNFIKK